LDSVLSTVKAAERVAIVTASARNLRAGNVSLFRLQPDGVRIVESHAEHLHDRENLHQPL
jgi:hypothetical protein